MSKDYKFTSPSGLSTHVNSPAIKLDIVPILDLCVIALLFSLFFSRFVMLPGVRVELPETELRMHHNSAQIAVITIQKNGVLFFDGGVYDVASIEVGFRNYRMRNEIHDTVLLMKAEADMTMQMFLDICSMAKNTGFIEVQVFGKKIEEAVDVIPFDRNGNEGSDMVIPIL